MKKIRELNAKMNDRIYKASDNIEKVDLEPIFKMMFELWDLTDFGEHVIPENNERTSDGVTIKKINVGSAVKLVDFL